jgi:primosomal protein N' (replication factor Y) (superfamily II helicase)
MQPVNSPRGEVETVRKHCDRALVGSSTDCYVRVAIPVPVDRLFDYRVPEHLRPGIEPGKRVLVPFGRRKLTGYCVESAAETDVPEKSLRDVVEIVDDEPVVLPELLTLTRWIGHYYHCSWGEALQAVLPAGVRRHRSSAKTYRVELSIRPDRAIDLADAMGDREAKQARILRALAEAEISPTTKDLLSLVRASRSPLDTLRKKDLVRIVASEAAVDPFRDTKVDATDPLALTDEQRVAFDAIRDVIVAETFRTFLLYGVTGSGKTEIYLQALSECVEQGRQGIVLVPEIALTPQTTRRFRQRFARVSILHSGLSDATRSREWRRIRRGEADVVIGPRSAIFAPVPRLGLVVIDEEHEATFKQQSTPRYHARDAGIVRARDAGAAVILGSATPSLESWRNAKEDRFGLLRLEKRIGERTLPPVEVVDMTTEGSGSYRNPIFSRRLVILIEEALREHKQTLLFLNRRGFATFLNCRACGHVLECPKCAISLTYHRSFKRAACHYCGHEMTPPAKCPECKGPPLKLFGKGTERIEKDIARLFPNARIARMDSDTMKGQEAYDLLLGRFGRGEIDILVGTQMIAKGLHFPGVTVVGVVSADTSLAIPDFRSAERTFQLISQVAGRTGRGESAGRVVVQTENPEHPSITAAAEHDFIRFAHLEMKMREELSYPPFTRIVRLIVQGKDRDRVAEAANRVAAAARATEGTGGVEVLGPAPAPIERLGGKYRYHAVAKVHRPRGVAVVARAAEEAMGTRKGGVDLTVDVDAVSLL